MPFVTSGRASGPKCSRQNLIPLRGTPKPQGTGGKTEAKSSKNHNAAIDIFGKHEYLLVVKEASLYPKMVQYLFYYLLL